MSPSGAPVRTGIVSLVGDKNMSAFRRWMTIKPLVTALVDAGLVKQVRLPVRSSADHTFVMDVARDCELPRTGKLTVVEIMYPGHEISFNRVIRNGKLEHLRIRPRDERAYFDWMHGVCSKSAARFDRRTPDMIIAIGAPDTTDDDVNSAMRTAKKSSPLVCVACPSSPYASGAELRFEDMGVPPEKRVTCLAVRNMNVDSVLELVRRHFAAA